MENASDNELLGSLALGDVRAFRKIYDRYADRLYIYAHNIIKDKSICEDAIQNLFMDIWHKRSNLCILNLSSYLFRAVKFQIFKHFRNQKLSDADLTRLNIVDAAMNTSGKIEYEDLQKAIDNCLAKLPKRCRQIFVMSRYHHKSNREISDELDISIQAVKNQMSKGIKFIRKNLEQEELVLFYFMVFE